jgi:hypothetical protein
MDEKKTKKKFKLTTLQTIGIGAVAVSAIMVIAHQYCHHKDRTIKLLRDNKIDPKREHELLDRINTLQSDNFDKQDEIERLKGEGAKKEPDAEPSTQIRDLQDKLQALQAELNAKTQVQAKKALQTQLTKEQQAELLAKTKALQDEKNSKEALKRQLAQKQLTKQALETQLAEEQQTKQALETQLAEEQQVKQALETQLAKEQQVKQALEVTTRNLQIDLNSKNESLEEQKKSNTGLRDLLNTKNKEEKLQLMTQQLDSEKAKLRIAVARHAEDLKQQLKQTNEGYAQRLETVQTQHTQALAKAALEAKEKLDGVKKQLTKSKIDLDTVNKELKEAKRKHTQQLETVNQELQKSLEAKTQLETVQETKQLEAAQKESLEAKTQLEAAKKQHTKQLETAQKNHTQQLKIVNQELQESLEANTQLVKAQEQLQTVNKELQESKKALKNEVAHAKVKQYSEADAKKAYALPGHKQYRQFLQEAQKKLNAQKLTFESNLQEMKSKHESELKILQTALNEQNFKTQTLGELRAPIGEYENIDNKSLELYFQGREKNFSYTYSSDEKKCCKYLYEINKQQLSSIQEKGWVRWYTPKFSAETQKKMSRLLMRKDFYYPISEEERNMRKYLLKKLNNPPKDYQKYIFAMGHLTKIYPLPKAADIKQLNQYCDYYYKEDSYRRVFIFKGESKDIKNATKILNCLPMKLCVITDDINIGISSKKYKSNIVFVHNNSKPESLYGLQNNLNEYILQNLQTYTHNMFVCIQQIEFEKNELDLYLQFSGFRKQFFQILIR